jgi:hypothetical protein
MNFVLNELHSYLSIVVTVAMPDEAGIRKCAKSSVFPRHTFRGLLHEGVAAWHRTLFYRGVICGKIGSKFQEALRDAWPVG